MADHLSRRRRGNRRDRFQLVAIALAIVTLAPPGCVPRAAIQVTGLFPVSSSLADKQNPSLQPSRCFWLGNGDSETLAWDTAITATVNGAPASFTLEQPPPPQTTDRLNACYTGPLRINGTRAAVPPWGVTVPASLLECQLDPADTLGTCLPPQPDASCAALSNQGCVGGETARNYPYCSTGCDVAVTFKDSTVELQSTLFDTPITFAPTLYPVTNTRVMARQTQPCTVVDPETGELQCVWHEGDPSAALWDENFSPKLFVSQVLAFVLPNGGDPNDSRNRRYIALERVEVGNPPINYRCGANRIAPTQADADSCARLSEVTPAYVKALQNQAAPWMLMVRDAAHGGDPTVGVGSQPYLQFTVANPTIPDAGPFLFPTDYDFGVIPAGQTRTVPAAVLVWLSSATIPWTLQSISFDTNPADFDLQLQGPATIGAGGVRGLTVSFKPSSPRLKIATGTLTFNDQNGHTQARTLSLAGTSGAQPPILQPDQIRYHPGDPHAIGPLPWRLRFLVESAGVNSIVRQAVTISGPNASMFKVYEGATGTTPPLPSFPIASGDAELFSVDFCPNARGMGFAAQVNVTVDEGVSSPVLATGSVALTGDAPDPPTQLCP